MDIKGIVRNVNPFGTKAAEAKASEISEAAKAGSKTDANNDREGNGQAATSGEEDRRKPTPEEIADAVKYLEALPGIKDNQLQVRLVTNDDVSVVFIEDRFGKIVRRIPETELRQLTSNREKKSGHLLNRAL